MIIITMVKKIIDSITNNIGNQMGVDVRNPLNPKLKNKCKHCKKKNKGN